MFYIVIIVAMINLREKRTWRESKKVSTARIEKNEKTMTMVLRVKLVLVVVVFSSFL